MNVNERNGNGEKLYISIQFKLMRETKYLWNEESWNIWKPISNGY